MKKIAVLSLKVAAAFAIAAIAVCQLSNEDFYWTVLAFLAFIAVLPAVWVGVLIAIVESINFVKGGIK